MRNVAYVLSTAFLSLSAAAACAQGASPCPTGVDLTGTSTSPAISPDLVCLLPQVYGAGGLVGKDHGGPLLINSTHEAHFQSSNVRSLTPINAEIGVQLSQLPIAAPVAGYLFENGALTSVTESLGPILSDRADTLGKKRIFLSLSYQYFNFDKVDGIDLRSFGAIFTHEAEYCTYDPVGNPDDGSSTACLSNNQYRYTNDVISTTNGLSLRVNQVTVVGTYGISDNLDLSLAVPILNIRVGFSSVAKITNIPTNQGDECSQEHVFANGTDATSCLNQGFSNRGTATGMGDMTLRLKQRVYRGEGSSVAVGSDFRIPTGDALNFLGAGTWGFRPFAIYSAKFGRLSPHASTGIQVNGQSLLAGDVTGAIISKAHLPNDLSYAGGVDITLRHRFGVSGDFLGQTLLHGTRLRASHSPGYTDLNPVYAGDPNYTIAPMPTVATTPENINIASAAVGIKVNPFSNLLITVNGLFRLNDGGLHAKPAPLIGISYSF